MKFLLLILALSFVSCSEDTFPKYVALGTLRILDLAASTPEVNPGASVTITPYLSDVNNAGNLTYAWQACVDPGISYGAVPTCTGSSTATAVTTGTLTVGVDLLSSNTYTQAVTTFSVSVPSTILSLASTQDQYNGVNYLVTYQVTNTSGETVKAFKRIVVTDSSKTTKNTNPTVSQIYAGGTAIGSLSNSAEVTLTNNASGAESYSVKASDGSLSSATETLQTTWFYSDGSLKYYRTTGSDSNIYTAPSSWVSGRNAFLVAVVRDGRGGIAVVKANIH